MKKKAGRFQKENLRKGIYILPNIFTSLNIFCGFLAVISSIHGKFQAAAISILVAVIFDILDGKIARATNTSSKFGIEYDSLADLISFGMAPGLMMYLWALESIGRIGWLAAFLFLVCGALRLARFNTKAELTPSDHFLGLPIPAAAGMNSTFMLFCIRFDIIGSNNRILVLFMLIVLSFLMVSSIKYNSFKKAELFKRMNFNVLLVVILIFISIVSQPSVVLFIIALAYVTSGPLTLIKDLKSGTESEPAPEIESETEDNS